MTTSSRRVTFSLLLLGVTAIWGWTFTLVKAAVTGYSVLGFLSLRFALAAAVLAPVAAKQMHKRDWGVGVAIGLALAAGFLLQTFGLKTTTPTNSGLITGLFVVFAAVWNRALFGVRTPRNYPLLLACSLTGLALLTGAGPALPKPGDLLTLACAVAFGLHVALLDRHAKGHSARALALVQLGTTAVVCSVAWPVAEPLVMPGRDVWGAIALCGGVASAAAFLIQTLAQRELPAAQAAMILTMEPVFAGYFGNLLAGDALTPLQYAGAAMMMAALLAANLGPKHEEALLER